MVIPQQCLFCTFEPEYIISENEHAFATYFPRAIKIGHLVVAVKNHKPSFTDITDEEARSVMSLGLLVATIAKDLIDAEKYYVVSIGDLDHHFHIHLLPKKASDVAMGKYIMLDGGWKGEVGENITADHVLEFIAAIRKRL